MSIIVSPSFASEDLVFSNGDLFFSTSSNCFQDIHDYIDAEDVAKRGRERQNIHRIHLTVLRDIEIRGLKKRMKGLQLRVDQLRRENASAELGYRIYLSMIS